MFDLIKVLFVYFGKFFQKNKINYLRQIGLLNPVKKSNSKLIQKTKDFD